MKKGFTIIEIIISILLVTIIGTTSVVSYNYVEKKNKINTLNDKSDEILIALRTYIETNSTSKEQIYNNKNGMAISLKTLENEGLIDFNDLKVEDEYVVAFLSQESDCADITTIESWDLTNGPLYICLNSKNSGSSTIKETLTIGDVIYEARGSNPNNWVIFDVNTDDTKWTWWPDTTDEDGIKLQDLWRIVSIDTDGTIKLIYNQPAKSDNSRNYDTSKFQTKKINNDTYETADFYKLIHDNNDKSDLCEMTGLNKSCGTDFYYLYNDNNVYTVYDALEAETVEGSKKSILYNSIVNKNYIISNDYYYEHTHTYVEVFQLKLNSSFNSKLGFINDMEYEASFLGGNSYLMSMADDMIIGKGLYEKTNYDRISINYIRKNGSYDSTDVSWNLCGWSIGYGGSCSEFRYIHYLAGENYYPVITLNSKVEIVNNTDTGCTKNNLGTKKCPYKLTCSDC